MSRAGRTDRGGAGCGPEAHARGGASPGSRGRGGLSPGKLLQCSVWPIDAVPTVRPRPAGTVAVCAGLPEKVALSEDLSLHTTPCRDRGQDGRHPVLLLTSPFSEEETGLQGGWATCPESQERVSGAPSSGQLSTLGATDNTADSCSGQLTTERWPRAQWKVHPAWPPAWPLTGVSGRRATSLLLAPSPAGTRPHPDSLSTSVSRNLPPWLPLTSPAHQHSIIELVRLSSSSLVTFSKLYIFRNPPIPTMFSNVLELNGSSCSHLFDF